MSVMLVDNTDDPDTYEEAMMTPDSNKWQEAMKSEIGSMYENQVWTLWTYRMAERLSRTNGFSRRKQMLMVMLLSIKLDLSQKGFDKFKELTTMRLSHR